MKHPFLQRISLIRLITYFLLVSITQSCSTEEENFNLGTLEVHVTFASYLSDISLEGLEVSISNNLDNITSVLYTDNKGLVTFSNIPIGTYTIVVAQVTDEYELKGTANSISVLKQETVNTTIEVNTVNKDGDIVMYGNWVKRSSFNGESRSNSISFTVGKKGYLVTGFDGDDQFSDTWLYDSEGDYWVRRADFPGTTRSHAVGFSINGKGYLGTGYNYQDNSRLKDFWEYDPATDTWTQKADFGGTARYGAIGFSIGNDGYIGTGYDGSEQKDFWKYNVATDTWEQSVGFGGQNRMDASVFKIGEVAYIGLGIYNGAYEEDFYAFDGTEWTRLTDLDDDDDHQILLSSGVAFSLDGIGYVTTGIFRSVTTKTWSYDPTTDTWDKLPAFEGIARQGACSFNFDDKAFVLTGRNGHFRLDDVWEFRPDELENEDD